MMESETDMIVQDLDVTDPTRLEAALDAAPQGTLARVLTGEGEPLLARRVPGGWHLPGDVAVASADVAGGAPRAATLLLDDGRPATAGYLAPAAAVYRAWSAMEEGDREGAEAMAAELDDLASAGWEACGLARDCVEAWLLFGDDPFDEEDYR
jgi:hypothetical protein